MLQKRSRPHKKKTKRKYIFQEDRSALLEITPTQSSINKGDAFLICHSLTHLERKSNGELQ
jgi:hypothetical protein